MLRTNSLLNVRRKRRRNAVGIDQRVVEALRLEEDLVSVTVREALHLVLDRRAIARPAPLDRAGKQGRTVEIRLDDLVRRARWCARWRSTAAAAERHRRAPTWSSLRRRSAAPRASPNRSSAHRAAAACRSSAVPEPSPISRIWLASAAGGALTPPAALDHLFADEHPRIEERAGRHTTARQRKRSQRWSPARRPVRRE